MSNNNDYVVTGHVHSIGEIQKISDKFQKREVVIKTEGDYPQYIGCQLSQDKCQMGDHLDVGDKIEAHINLRGREWTNPKTKEVKYFNSIEIWRIDLEEEKETKIDRSGIADNFIEDAIQTQANEMEDDMPF